MTFSMLDHIEKLTPTEEQDRYFCPACGKNDFTVDYKSGAYSCWSGGCTPKQIRDAIAPLPEKKTNKKQERTWDYLDIDGNKVIQVVRKDDGRGKKDIFQRYWYQDQWSAKAADVPNSVKASLKALVTPYRYLDAIQHDVIFWVEGEKAADSLWKLGLPAVTSIGGGKGLARYGKYEDLFAGKKLILCPDMDEPGINYMHRISALFPAESNPDNQWLYVYPDDERWSNLPEDNGLDIYDWIESGVDAEKILSSIEPTCRPNLLQVAQYEVERENEVSKVKKSKAEREDLDKYEVTSTPDDWLFQNYFGARNGDWGVIDDSFYQYTSNGYYRHIKDQVVNRILADTLRKLYSVKVTKNDSINQYKYATDSYLKSALGFNRKALMVGDDLTETPYFRAFRNCTLDLRTGEILEHSKEHFLTSAIDSDYIPNQECPEVFKHFIASSYGEDMLPLIRACTSMLLDPTAPWGKFPYPVGESGSGKGTLVRFWQSLYGEEHVRSSGSFSDLSTPDGRHQHLSGVAIFAIPDIGGFVQGLKSFYELVDNGSMSGRALYQSHGYQKRWNTRFLIASVVPIRVENSGDGWDRRAIPLPTLPRHERPFEPDPDLESKLQDPQVKAAVISWALAMDKDERKAMLMAPGEANERVANLQNETALMGDPIKAFVDHCLRPSEDSSQYSSVELYEYFCLYADAFGYARSGEKTFAGHLRTVIPYHYKPRRRMTTKDEGYEPGARQYVAPHWTNLAIEPETMRALLDLKDPCKTKPAPLNKSNLREGGLYEFMEWCPSGSEGGGHGSEGSVGASEPKKIPETPENTRGLDNGSDGSDGSQGFSYIRENPELQKEVNLVDPVEKIYKGYPLPSEPSEPNPETLTVPEFAVVQMGLRGASEPSEPSEPLDQVSAHSVGVSHGSEGGNGFGWTHKATHPVSLQAEPCVVETDKGMFLNVVFADGRKNLVRKSEIELLA